MTRYHGSEARAYFGARDISDDARQIQIKTSAAVHDSTSFATNGWSRSDPGLLKWDGSMDAFFDPATGGVAEQIDALLGVASGPLSIYNGKADAIGDTGFVGGSVLLIDQGEPVSVAELRKLTGTLEGQGRASRMARLLHVLGAESATGNSSSLDNAASSANGGRGNLHVTTVGATSNWTVKIQHSSDNSSWADLMTFTATAAATSESKEVTGTVNRYLRAAFTKNSGSNGITFVLGFARY